VVTPRKVAADESHAADSIACIPRKSEAPYANAAPTAGAEIVVTRVSTEDMTLRRRSPPRPWAQFWLRMLVLLTLLVLIVGFHWFERDSLVDESDGKISFTDVIYFTMISATTTGYGDIVPVTDRARMFDALIVTPIRVFFILILAGTAYTFVIKRTWNELFMRAIQRTLRDHVILAGFGVSNSKALEELLARGMDPRKIVVIDSRADAIDRAERCGVAVLLGDASRDETLHAARIEYASALLVSAGRDDSAILIVLTARKLAPQVKITVTIRSSDNEDISRHAGADTVINPVNFAGLLLASSLQGPHRAEYLADLATTEGQVMLRERVVQLHEIGKSLLDICTGQPVRLIRDGKPHGPRDPAIQDLRAGDRILEIIDRIS
jgi:voltage-gated potassium channel